MVMVVMVMAKKNQNLGGRKYFQKNKHFLKNME